MASESKGIEDGIQRLVEETRAVFESHRSLPLEWRKRQLRGIKDMVQRHEEELVAALRQDLGANDFWARGIEIGLVVSEAELALRHVKEWMAPVKVSTPLVQLPASSYVKRDPFGTCLIISPWNYPVTLLLNPLIACVAAGNCAVLKPSEVSVATSALLAQLIPRYLDKEAIRVVEGAIPESTALLKQRWDMIFYTGSTMVGKIVHAAAAKHLTPVVLELGGKCPVIVADDASVSRVAKRVLWAKFSLNMGQSCLSPDYVLCTPSMLPRLLTEFKKVLEEFYTAEPKTSPDVSRIINERHAKRVASLLADPTLELVAGADIDIADRYISPTLVLAKPDSKCMQSEIFGPVLPILTVPSVQAAVRFIRERPKPLGLYVFTSSNTTADYVLHHTSSGSAIVNDCAVACANHALPFGGVQESGTGSYHGIYGFNAFSHGKAVMYKYGNDVSLRFPPYSAGKTRWLIRLMQLDMHKLKPWLWLAGGAVLGVAGVLTYRYLSEHHDIHF